MKQTRKNLVRLMLALVIISLSCGQAFAVTKPNKITIKSSARTIYVGGKATVSVKSVSPKRASKKVIYKSSNKSIATVSTKGIVKGRKAGKVRITVYSKYRKKVKASVVITVKKKPSVSPTPEPEIVPDYHAMDSDSVLGYIMTGDSKVLLIDVRSESKYEESHLIRTYSAPMVNTVGTLVSDTTGTSALQKVVNSVTAYDRIILVGDEEETPAKLAVKLLVKQGISNDLIYIADGGISELTDSRLMVYVKTSKAGMKYNTISSSLLHSDINSDESIYVNRVDAREKTDFGMYHLKGSVSVPIPNYDATLSLGKNNMKAYMEGRSTDDIYLVLCNASEEYTDAATTLLVANGVPTANIVRVDGGLSNYIRYYSEDIEYGQKE